MKRFFASKENFNNNQIVLDDVEHNHLKNVLRLSEGESVIVVCGDEYDYECKIVRIAKNNTLLEIKNKYKNEYNPHCNVTVFQALTKSENMSLIVQKLTELGVTKFIPFESRYITSKDKFNKCDKLQTVSNQSIKQCKRSIPMIVEKTLSFSQMVAELEGFDVVIFANETEKTKKLEDVQLASNNKVAIIVGSEGGFSEDECKAITNKQNAVSISLGKRILRAETAAIALTSVVMYKMGEWDYDI